jgi:hypothetical protein
MNKNTLYVIGISLFLIVVALIWRPNVEGFQTSTLPTGSQTVTDFVIYSDMNTIMEKLPFLHTNFTDINIYETSALTGTLTMMPTTVTPTTISLSNMITNNSVPKLYSFKLKSSITGPIDQSSVDALNNASTSLFGATGKIAFKTINGNLYPSIMLPSAAAAPTTSSTSATPSTSSAPATSSTSEASSTSSTPTTMSPTDDFYKSDDPTDMNIYYLKTVAGVQTKYTIPSTVNSTACAPKMVPEYASAKTLAADILAAITPTMTAACTDLP